MSKWFVPPDRDIEAEAKAQGWTPPPRPAPLPADSALEVLTAPGPAKQLEIICRAEDTDAALAVVVLTALRAKPRVEAALAVLDIQDGKLPTSIVPNGHALIIDETLPRRRVRYRLTGQTTWREISIQDQE